MKLCEILVPILIGLYFACWLYGFYKFVIDDKNNWPDSDGGF